MADFCTRCAKELFGYDKPRFIDIDLEEESKSIADGNYAGPYLCEGCGYIYIYNVLGNIRIERFFGKERTISKIEDVVKLPTLEDFLKQQMPKINS